MPLTPGSKLGPYEIVAPLGAGGMGEVFRARDPRLGREVAIKALPPMLATDPERVARFEREAKLLASLSHSNIGGLFGLEEQDGERYLVLELIDGETLAARIARGPLPLDEALDVCRQIAAAIEAAHESGIVHRDLKPGNVMITASGMVKVVDFGLAKSGVTGGSSPDAALSASPTMTYMATGAGIILGTAAYMSPEQARGRAVDRRTDIWSFGCVLYECLTGRRAFEGETVSDLVARILEREPEWSALPAGTPPRVRELLRRCLTKDARERLRDIGEARVTLESPNDPLPGAAESEQHAGAGERTRRSWLGWTIGALGVIAALAMLAVSTQHSEPPVMRTIVQQPPNALFLFTGDNAGPPEISPDAQHIVFVAVDDERGARLWLRDLSGLTARPLPGTENAVYPFWAPDGRSIGFFADFKLKRVDLATGQVFAVCSAVAGRGGTWSRQGVIVFTPDFVADLMQVPAMGGTPTRITTRDTTRHTTHRWPQFLPDGRHFLYFAGNHANPTGDENGVWVGSLDGRPGREVLRSPTEARFAEGYLLYVQDSVLMARPFDPGAARFTGDANPTAERVQVDQTTWKSNVSASQAGILVYEPIGGQLGSQIQLRDRAGHVVKTIGESGNHFAVRLSPDGGRVVYSSQISPTGDLFTFDLERDITRRLTLSDNDDDEPALSPDGRQVAYTTRRDPRLHYTIQVIPSDGNGRQRLLHSEADDVWPLDWSSDGRWLLFGKGNFSGIAANSLGVLAMDGSTPTRYIAAPSGSIAYAAFSHDAHWVAYGTAGSGQPEVYVQPVPTAAASSTGEGSGAIQVSSHGGTIPRWRSDDRELYFARPDGMIVSVPMTPGTMAPGAETPLFRAIMRPDYMSLDVSGDGQKFLVNVLASGGAAPIVVVSGWKRALKPQ